jgi:hypothetical protein
MVLGVGYTVVTKSSIMVVTACVSVSVIPCVCMGGGVSHGSLIHLFKMEGILI